MFNMRTACNAAPVKSVLWLLLNMLTISSLTFVQDRQLTKKHHRTGDSYPRYAAACLGGAGVPTYVCRVTGGAHIFEIQVSLNFLFKFTVINFVQLNINPVEFYLI